MNGLKTMVEYGIACPPDSETIYVVNVTHIDHSSGESAVISSVAFNDEKRASDYWKATRVEYGDSLYTLDREWEDEDWEETLKDDANAGEDLWTSSPWGDQEGCFIVEAQESLLHKGPSPEAEKEG